MDTIQKMRQSKIEKDGESIARQLRDMTVHSAVTYGNNFQATTLSIFAIVMKYLEDNREKLNLEIPDVLHISFMIKLLPEKTVYDRLKDYFSDIQRRLGIESETSFIYEELVYCGLKEKKDYILQVFSLVERMDFSREYGGRLALETASSLLAILNTNSHGIPQTMPTAVMRLLNRISNLEPGMECYGISDDSSMTLAILTAGKGCNVTSEISSYYHSALSCMFLILALGTGSITVLNSPVKWLPIGQEKKMGSFDRVYAFPPLGYKEEVREIFDCQANTPAHFIEWYPENIQCGEWLYARHMVTALKPGGIGYILFPLSSYSRMSIYQRVRQMFIEQNLVDAVIEFPPGTISGTSVTSALMIIKKGREEKNIYMMNLGGNAGKKLIQVKRGAVEYLDADRISQIILERRTQDGLSKKVTSEEIAANGYSFSPSAYVEEEVNLDELAANYEKLMARDKGLRSRYEDACESYEAAMIQFDHVMRTMRGI